MEQIWGSEYEMGNMWRLFHEVSISEHSLNISGSYRSYEYDAALIWRSISFPEEHKAQTNYDRHPRFLLRLERNLLLQAADRSQNQNTSLIPEEIMWSQLFQDRKVTN